MLSGIWTTNNKPVINCCIQLVDSFECVKMHGPTNPKSLLQPAWLCFLDVSFTVKQNNPNIINIHKVGFNKPQKRRPSYKPTLTKFQTHPKQQKSYSFILENLRFKKLLRYLILDEFIATFLFGNVSVNTANISVPRTVDQKKLPYQTFNAWRFNI